MLWLKPAERIEDFVSHADLALGARSHLIRRAGVGAREDHHHRMGGRRHSEVPVERLSALPRSADHLYPHRAELGGEVLSSADHEVRLCAREIGGALATKPAVRRRPPQRNLPRREAFAQRPEYTTDHGVCRDESVPCLPIPPLLVDHRGSGYVPLGVAAPAGTLSELPDRGLTKGTARRLVVEEHLENAAHRQLAQPAGHNSAFVHMTQDSDGYRCCRQDFSSLGVAAAAIASGG